MKRKSGQFRWRTAVLAIWLGSLAGCQTMSWPDHARPGDIRYQQLRSQLLDPYPDVDLGPLPVGVRPRDFDQPYAEPVKAQWNYLGPRGRLPF